jgi:hypothetical protein
MASSIPGRRVERLYPPNLQHAMNVTRLANAIASRLGESSFRYIIVGPIHEAVDPGKVIEVLDSVEDRHMFVSELLKRLPEDLQKRVFYDYL